MSEMDRIGEAILAKVRSEADGILADARSKAEEILAKASRQREARCHEARARMREEASAESTRLLAQSSIAARQEILRAKNAIVETIFAAATRALASTPATPEELRRLIKDGIEALGQEKVRILVARRDAAAARKLISEDRELRERATEVKEIDCAGGAIIEDAAGKLRIDNTYETRREMMRPGMLLEASRELFPA